MSAFAGWFNSLLVGQNYKTMHYFAGTGGNTFDINFAGGYLSTGHVKALRDTGEELELTFLTGSRVRTSQNVPVGGYVLLYRDTPKDLPLVSFQDGAVLTGAALDRNAKQAVFVAAEMLDRFDTFGSSLETSVTQVSEALRVSSDALAKATEAVDIANAITRVNEDLVSAAEQWALLAQQYADEAAAVVLPVNTLATAALSKGYGIVGKNLVPGSFENGAVINNAKDVVVHLATGRCYSGPLGPVPQAPNAAYIDESATYLTASYVYPEDFGVKYGVDSTAAMQACLDYAVLNGRKVKLRGNVVVSSLNVAGDWKSIQITSDFYGVAYSGSEGRTLTFTAGGLVIPLKSNNHNRIDIRGITFVRSGSSRQSSCIDFQIDGTRPYNYPIMWVFEDVNFRKFDSVYRFQRSGGVVDPNGFVGTFDITRINVYDCNRLVLVDGCYLNLVTVRTARLHGMAEGVRVKGSGGCFMDFYNAHWEGVNDNQATSNGIIVVEGFSLETRFSFHNHDWERCGQMVRVLGTQTRKVRLVFTGKNRFNSYLIPKQEFVDVELSNHSGDMMEVAPVRTVIHTPESVRVVTRPYTGLDGSRISSFYVPVGVYQNHGINQVSDMLAGVRRFGAAGVQVDVADHFDWIGSLGDTFYSSNSPATGNGPVYCLSGVLDCVQGTTKILSPLVGTFNDGSDHNWVHNDLATTMPTGRYSYCALLDLTGVTLSNLVATYGSPSGSKSIGYGRFLGSYAAPALELLPASGCTLKTTRQVLSGSTVSVPVRDGGGTGFCVDVEVSTSDGKVLTRSIVRGVTNNAASKTVLPVITSVDPAWVVTITTGDNPDFALVTLTNNTGASADARITVNVK